MKSEDLFNKFLEMISNLEQELHTKLGVPKRFFMKLNEEDDWSFIIKLHTLIEGAASDLLTKSIGAGCLSDVFSRLELSDNKTGKIAFIKGLNLLPKEHIIYVQKLSELRNKLAHDISNIIFNLEYYVRKLDKKQIKVSGDAFTFYFKDIENTKDIKNIDFFKNNPKLSLWLGALIILQTVYKKKTNYLGVPLSLTICKRP